MNFTDTHTHLYLEEFKNDIDTVIDAAIAKNVDRFFLPNIDSTSVSDLFNLVKRFPEHCFPMMGLHPCSVKADYEHEMKMVEHWLSKQQFYAVGEIGIDLYWDTTFRVQQEHAFREQIRMAKQHNLPIVIHSRNSFDEVYKIVRELQDGSLKGIFHCFSGTLEQANKFIEIGGFKLGIGGVVTFKNSGLDKVVEQIDLKHLVLETDSPYLAPTPHRGKRNESAYIPLIAEKVAALQQVSIEQVAEVTTKNADFIFGTSSVKK